MAFQIPINRTPEDVKVFGPDDPYYWLVDNRPLLQLLDSDLALATQLEWTMTNDCEEISFTVENPAAETGFGGMHVCRTGGLIVAVRISCTQLGSSGNFDFDLLMNGGNTVYTNTANRPTLAFNSPTGWTDSILPGITVVPQNATLVGQLHAIQGGTPRWFRAAVWVQKPQASE